MSFSIFYIKKTPLKPIKTNSSNSRKPDLFQEVLTHSFGPKLGGGGGNIGQENVFYDIVEQKKAFLGYKNKNLKRSTNWHFSIGVNPWLWSKNGPCSNFFFLRQYRPGKCLLLYSTSKKRICSLQKKSLKSRKLTFFQRG